MANNNIPNSRTSSSQSIVLTTRKPSEDKEIIKHHKSHHTAIILTIFIILPFLTFIILESIKQLAARNDSIKYLSEDSKLDFYVEASNGTEVNIDFSKTKNNEEQVDLYNKKGSVECLLAPSISSKFIMSAFHEHKSVYNEQYISFKTERDEEPKIDIKIDEYSPVNTLICRLGTVEGNIVNVYKPVEVKTGILYYTQPTQPTKLEAKTHGDCVFLTGQKPVNQDILCWAGDRNKEVNRNDILGNKGKGSNILYLRGTRIRESFYMPFEIVECGNWKSISELKCTSNISIETDLIEENNKDIKNVYLKEEQEIKLTIQNNKEKPISKCLEDKGISEGAVNLAFIEDSLLESFIDCEKLNINHLKTIDRDIGVLMGKPEFVEWGNGKIKELVYMLKVIMKGDENEENVKQLTELIHGSENDK